MIRITTVLAATAWAFDNMDDAGFATAEAERRFDLSAAENDLMHELLALIETKE